MYETRPGEATTSNAIQTPAKIGAQRLRGRDTTPSAVGLREPPTGRPRKRPEATLAAPWATKSRDMLRRDPSGLGTLWLTPAPCTRLIAATANAPLIRSSDRPASDGKKGVGMPLGIWPTSR